MKSFRDFVRKDLIPKLLRDVHDLRIFNEADLQYRAAYHLDNEYYPDLLVTNQPRMRLGRTRAVTSAKPDLVAFHPDKGPKAALELKCFLKPQTPFTFIKNSVRRDINKLQLFRNRYPNSEYAFAVVFVNVDKDTFSDLCREFAIIDTWMKHYCFPHVVNIFCDENERRRNWHKGWEENMVSWWTYFAGQ